MADKLLPKFKNYTGQPVNFIQPKLDGHYTKIIVDAEGIIQATSKKPIDITEKLLEIDHINAELSIVPPNSILLCELHCPGIDATSVPTLLNAADEKLMLTVFAVPVWKGEDRSNPIPAENNLCNLMEWIQYLGLSAARAIRVTTDFVDEKGCDALNELAIQNGFEGHVLKVSHMSGWYKLKPVRELDAIVIGTEMSTSESYWGLLKAVKIAVHKPDGTYHILGSCGIGVKAIKEEFDTEEKRKTLIGRVCEVHYDKVESQGGLRFPRFIRWRDDEKLPEECTTEQFNYYKGKMIR